MNTSLMVFWQQIQVVSRNDVRLIKCQPHFGVGKHVRLNYMRVMVLILISLHFSF